MALRGGKLISQKETMDFIVNLPTVTTGDFVKGMTNSR